jgi:hypothetical protein
MVTGEGGVAELWQLLHDERLSIKSRFPEYAWREIGLESANERAAKMRSFFPPTTINALLVTRSKQSASLESI